MLVNSMVVLMVNYLSLKTLVLHVPSLSSLSGLETNTCITTLEIYSSNLPPCGNIVKVPEQNTSESHIVKFLKNNTELRDIVKALNENSTLQHIKLIIKPSNSIEILKSLDYSYKSHP